MVIKIRTPLFKRAWLERIFLGAGSSLYLDWYVVYLRVYIWQSLVNCVLKICVFTVCKLYPSWKKIKDLVSDILYWSLGEDLSNFGLSVCINIGRNVTFLKLIISQSKIHYYFPRHAETYQFPWLSTFCQCFYTFPQAQV